MILKDIRTEFKPAKIKEVISPTFFSHKIMRGKLKGSNLEWSTEKKCRGYLAKAKAELLAQEFFRLIIPHQPKTLLMINSVTGVHYILSQEVEGYSELPENQAENFANGDFHRFRSILLTSMFLEETDLKNGNFGLNDKNQVIKIDGDNCFGQFFVPKKYFMTPEGIANLPYPKDFYAYHWLDIVNFKAKQPASSIISPDLGKSAQFRAEVNQAMLIICLLPESIYRELC